MTGKIFGRILDRIPTAVIVVDSNLKTVYTNAPFRTLFSSLKTRGALGAVTGCAKSAKRCNAELCGGCNLVSAFEDSVLSQREIRRRILQRVKGDDGETDVSYSLSVAPLGDGLYMGTIDDAFELEIAREISTAKSIQQRLLPAGKWAGGKRYAFTYIPCREIGGDLPDVYERDGAAFGMIADVSGKGVAAGMLSAFVKAAYDKTASTPARAIQNLSDKFRELSLDERNYVTVAAVKIEKNFITYSMAGHNVPILLKTRNGITRVMLDSPPVSNWFDNPSYFDDTLPYEKGDILVLLTDGVTECKNDRGEFFGSDGAIKTLSYSRTAEDFIKNLEDNLKSFAIRQSDDVTAIAFDL